MAFELRIIKNTPNPLFNRKELKLEIIHTNQASPDKASVTNELSSNYAMPAQQIYVYDMCTKRGLHKTIAKASLYNTFEDLKKIERAFVVRRITGEKVTMSLRKKKQQAKTQKLKGFGTRKRIMKRAAARAEEQ